MLPEIVLIVVFAAAGVAAGWVLGQRHKGKTSRQSTRTILPEHWPLLVRPLVNHNESIIWRWVRATFPEQRVLVKLPFSRFTLPANAQFSRAHFDMLNGLYATFTIADRDGRVIGCIDLISRHQDVGSSQQLKQEILAGLGIAYEVIRGIDLPSAALIRMAILGDVDPLGPESLPSALPFENSQFEDARVHLQQMLDRQRDRRGDFRPSGQGEFRPSDLADLVEADEPPTTWQAPLQ